MIPEEPFLSVDDFAAMFRPLSAAETEVVGPWLQLASDWIRERKPGIGADDAAARLVTFEVARDALAYGKRPGATQYAETVAHRSRSWTFAASAVEQWITDRHRHMLGLSVVAGPVFSFPVGDY